MRSSRGSRSSGSCLIVKVGSTSLRGSAHRCSVAVTGRSYFTLRSLGILTVTYLVFMVLISGIVIPGVLRLTQEHWHRSGLQILRLFMALQPGIR